MNKMVFLDWLIFVGMVSGCLAHLAKNMLLLLAPEGFPKSFMSKREQEKKKRERARAVRGRETVRVRDCVCGGVGALMYEFGQVLSLQRQIRHGCFQAFYSSRDSISWKGVIYSV